MKKTALYLITLLAIILSVALPACRHHDGLIPAMADGSLAGCVEWAQKNGDAEIEALCRAGKPLPAVLDLFLARQTKAQDAGADQ